MPSMSFPTVYECGSRDLGNQILHQGVPVDHIDIVHHVAGGSILLLSVIIRHMAVHDPSSHKAVIVI